MKPPPWSYSSLDSLIGCPRKHYEVKVAKNVEDVQGEAALKGTEMHKHFEDRLGPGKIALPDYMAGFEPFMQEIEGMGGTILVERKVGLTKKLEPCDFYASDVWWRGVIDVEVRKPDGTITIVDYKTGKPHNKMRQLHLFSLYGFVTGATMVESMFYWTQTKARTRIKLPRQQMGPILQSLVPDLTEYVEAFRLDLWPAKPSGLCAKYCNVVDCEFHGVRWSTDWGLRR